MFITCKNDNFWYTGWGKSKFIVVSTQNSLFLYYLLMIVLFSIQTAINLLLPHPVLGQKILLKLIAHVLTTLNVAAWKLKIPQVAHLYFYLRGLL